MKKLIYLFLILSAGLVVSCKKDNKPDNNNNNIAPSKTGSTLDLIRDSIYLYSQESYLWYDGLPDYATFNPRSITGSNDLSALAKVVDKISQYKINPATNKPYEYYEPSPGEAKYSFIDEGGTSSSLNGVNGDFGFAPLYNTTTDLRIKYVYAGSPAGLAGIKRGYQITKINGQSNITYDNGGTTTQFVVNAIFNSNTVTMTLKRPDNTTFDVNLAVANYNVNPVITFKTLTVSGKKVGYIVFNSFVSEDVAKPKLQEAFNSFTANGITDLVVDLRYNGGGYVSTAEYLSNLIVPSTKSNTLMYNTQFNDKLASGKASILANQVRRDPTTGRTYNYAQFDYSLAGNAVNFKKEGSLNINRVFFIVTGSSASSSELVINNLRPHMNVQLIGTKSYGKPVGFFDIKINKYELYVPQFVTKNSAGQGDYFDGMLPGSINYPGKMDYDDVTKEFGDPTEGLLAHALSFVTTGNYITKAQSQPSDVGLRSFSAIQPKMTADLDDHKFNGMVHDKPLKIK